MKKAKVSSTSSSSKKMRPALTPGSRENQMISLAMNLVEERLLAGTASSQETTHFLKLASTKNQLELEKLKKENRLLDAKTETLESQKRTDEMYDKAIKAMREYSGRGIEEDD